MLSKNQVSEIRALHQKKQRELHQLFIAEGQKTVLEILRFRPELVQHVYALRDFTEQQGELLQSLHTEFSTITDSELERISILDQANQVLAICRYLKVPGLDFDFTKHYSLYLDGIRDPGNLGTLLRLADWFGMTKVFCSPDTCELYNPKVIQASMGSFLRVEVVYTPLPALLNANTITHVYGALLNGNNLYRENLQNGLIVIGNEARGISKENTRFVNTPITIPAAVSNATESLNAAMAAGIICGEFFRQLQQSAD